MAGGPIAPHSAFPNDSNGRLYRSVYSGAGGNAAAHELMWTVRASLDADASFEMYFAVPPSLPSGTAKIRLLMRASATSGVAKMTLSDGRCPAGSDPSAATLNAETQTSVTWGAGDTDKYKETKITITTVPQASDIIVCQFKFQTSGWTLAQIMGFQAFLIWE